METGVSPTSWLPGFCNKSQSIAEKRTNSGDTHQNPEILDGVTEFAAPSCGIFYLNKPYGQASRAISTGKLHTLPCFHVQPIKQVVYLCPSALAGGRSSLGACFPLICFQRLSLPNVATQRCPWRDNWHTRGSSVQVLSYYRPLPSNLLRLPWIGTELSRDVLNPAHVPL